MALAATEAMDELELRLWAMNALGVGAGSFNIGVERIRTLVRIQP